MDANKLTIQIEKLIEKINSLHFPFKDDVRRKSFDIMKSEICSLLEEVSDVAQ